MAPPDQLPSEGAADAVDRFDQFGQQPMTDVPPDAAQGEVPALGGPMAMGPGMALIEQRLRQVEGNPTLLINNQFKLEEMRLMQGTRGGLRESRPW
jgi:Ca-activated chloride channel family protein